MSCPIFFIFEEGYLPNSFLSR